jgi:hypothetical protein
LISLLLSGCNLAGGNSASSETIAQTMIASTVAALQTQLANSTNPTPAPVVATATQNIIPTATVGALAQPTAVIYSAPTATSQPNYLITGVEDITAPDNSVYKPGESFTKTWRLTNGGAATWTADFKLVFVSGDSMGAASVALGRSVAPNQTIDISVALVAPTTDGAYTGNFMLQTNSGKSFGFGTSAASPFWAKIKVQHLFQVTAASVTAVPASYSGVCPGSVTLSATITSLSAGNVTYYFVTSTGNSSTYTMAFSAAGSLTSAAITWPIVGPAPLTVHVYIETPNHQDFSEVTIPVTCTP